MRTCKAALAWAVLFGVAVPAGADVVTEWNTAALTSIRATSMPPPRASRALAILHAAIYDAVNGIARTHEAYLVHSTVPASASMEAAASGAAHRVLVMLIPARSTIFDAVHRQIVSGIRDSPQKSSGLVWGRLVADSLLAARANDGSDDVVLAPVTSAPGSWEPTPPAFAAYVLPQWGFVTPFAVPNIVDARPPGPPALDSDRWSADYNEVKALGAATGSTRTGDQTQIALFWADGAGTVTPPGHWNQIAQQMGAALGNTLQENARLFALLNLAMADAAICAWDAKYAFNFWRPVTAIRYGDGDGNPNTEADSTWSSLITTPPFPDYVSGHSTFSGAAATVLSRFYGTDNIAFVTGADATPGVYRSFASFSAAAAEAAVSRLYGGIHFRSANDDGRRSGMAIGEYAFRNYLQPKTNRSRSKAPNKEVSHDSASSNASTVGPDPLHDQPGGRAYHWSCGAPSFGPERSHRFPRRLRRAPLRDAWRRQCTYRAAAAATAPAGGRVSVSGSMDFGCHDKRSPDGRLLRWDRSREPESKHAG